MSLETKPRSFYYRRANWSTEQTSTLEQYLRKAFTDLPTIDKRVFKHMDGRIQGMHYQDSHGTGGLLFQAAGYVPGQAALLVPHAKTKAANCDSEEANPPPLKSYQDGEVFCLVKGDHVFICISGKRESFADNFIRHMLFKSNQDHLLDLLSIEAIANVQKVKQIKQQGVKSIELNASLYEATLDYESRKAASTNVDRNFKEVVVDSILETLKAVFTDSDNPDLRDIGKKENLNAKIVFSFDGRKKSKGEVGMERLEVAANDLLADGDEDGFKIVTGSGHRMTADHVRIREVFQLPSFGSSVIRVDAYEKLEEFCEKLLQSGVMAQ